MQLIKTGQIVQGKNSRYKILQTLSASGNQVVYRCQGENGGIYRLSHYQAGCPMTGEPRKRFLSLPQMPGILKPVDFSKDASMEFDVFPQAGNDIAAHNIGVMELIRYAIPQLNAGLMQIHRYGLLIRDLDPAYIVFDPAAKRAAFSQFSNLACINAGATATKAACSGIKPMYCPPEYQKMGWSIYSDYYALGVALLVSMKGESIFGGMMPQAIQQKASRWELPGIKRGELTGTPYSMLSLDQKVMYLIAGLTIPDPYQRWGYGEVRCWCAGQDIPLLQSGKRVKYQMTMPVTVNGVRCWDYDQLGGELLTGGTASEKVLPVVVKHMLSQNKKLGEKLRDISADPGLSAQGKVFYMGYTLSPGTSGFWWNGRSLRTTADIASFSSSQNNRLQMVSQMLRDHCFTFLIRLRGVNTPEDQKRLAAFLQLEQWEEEEDGKGAARFMMQMGSVREKKLQVQGTTYDSIEQFLHFYESKPDQLKKISSSVLNDKVFQSWAWSKGFGGMAEAAASQAASQGKEFYALLLLLEKMGTQKEKQMCRRIWLKYGPYAHITWLHENLNLYNNVMGNDMEFLRQLRSLGWSENTSLDEISRNTPAMEMAYQNFVRNTETNAVKLHCGIPIQDPKMIQPKDAEACFCCIQDQLEVPPAYIRQMGLARQTQKIKSWCDNAVQDAQKWLDEEIRKIDAVPGFTGKKNTTGEGGTILGLIVWIFVMLYIDLLSYRYQYHYAAAPYLLYIYLACTMAFPVAGLLWCYSRRMVRSQKGRQIDMLSREKQVLEKCKKDADDCAGKIISSLNCGRGFPLSLKQPLRGSAAGSHIVQEESRMNSACKIGYVVSTTAVALLLMTGQDMQSIGAVSAVLYCTAISAYIGIENKLTCRRGFLILGFEVLVLILLYNLLHNYFIIGGGIAVYLLREILFA